VPKKKVLGRGIRALFPEGVNEADRFLFAGIEKVKPNQSQPRKEINQEKLLDLAASIREKGILQPILVRPSGNGYEIVAGERRWRAAQMAGLKEIPVVVQEFSERESLEAALIENLQREDLSPIEEAVAYVELMKRWDLTQESLAQRLGKKRVTLANTVRLLQLSPKVQKLVSTAVLSAGHARTLLALPDKTAQEQLANEVVQKGLSVREVERKVKKLLKNKPGRTKTAIDPFVEDLETRLERHLGAKVRIFVAGTKGAIKISFHNLDELDGLIKRICP
jgi:ParB family chromosome partitioning protein